MVAPEDDRAFSLQEIRSAAANGNLAALARRLARRRNWLALASLFERAAGVAIALPLLEEVVRDTAAALRHAPDQRGDSALHFEEIRTVRLLAGETLSRRVPRPPQTESDRRALRTAGGILADAGDLHRAAMALEESTDWSGAAEVWGRLGELERMEACLAHEDQELTSRRASLGALRDVEILLAAGERLAALRLAERIPEGAAETAAARQIARSVAAHLVRARAVTLRLASGRAELAARFAASPAVLGRDPLAEIPLRDPAVSRRHALVTVTGDGATVADAGSRGGTTVAGARLRGVFPVRGAVEVTLGTSCRLDLEPLASGCVRIGGASGLDRGLLALVGKGALGLREVFPEAEGGWIELQAGCAQFCRPPELPVRIAGRLVSTRVDLLHGDELEVGSGAARLRVE